jgi:hypothetical protein
MTRNSRGGFSLFELLTLLGMGTILMAMFFPAVMKTRLEAARKKRASNLRQISIGINTYDATLGKLPLGVDENNFSVTVQLLPSIEQVAVDAKINRKKSVDDNDNLAVAAEVIPILQSPSDPVKNVTTGFAGTNILYCAGSETGLEKNNGAFCRDSKYTTIAQISDAGGSSNVMAAVETLKGDGSDKATDVRRQHVKLDKAALKTLKDDTGVEDFKNGKNIVGNRCANWLDGRFMQGTFNTTRLPNDDKPDVDCGGAGGLMSVRSLDGTIIVGMFDGHAITIDSKKIDLKVWKAMGDASKGGNPDDK